jgi:hypothetical protein
MAPRIKQIRFNYSSEFTQFLETFAKTHYGDTRKIFKSEWLKSKETNKLLFQEEIERIEQNGYEGDIEDKIFESIRYYYRKKVIKENKQKENPAIKPEKKSKKDSKLSGISSSLKEIIDNHIKNAIYETIDSINNITPANAFDSFCRSNTDAITRELIILRKKANRDLEKKEIEIKLKKAYKNRLYKLEIEALKQK